MCYLVTHSTHHSYMYILSYLLNNNTISTFLINGHIITRNYFQLRKEGNILFNDALNTFLFTVIWYQTYGKGALG